MSSFLNIDEIIDKNAYNISIYKHTKLIDPAFIVEFEKFAISISNGKSAIWWTEMNKKVMDGTVYVFHNTEDFRKFKEQNQNFINKINFIL